MVDPLAPFKGRCPGTGLFWSVDFFQEILNLFSKFVVLSGIYNMPFRNRFLENFFI